MDCFLGMKRIFDTKDFVRFKRLKEELYNIKLFKRRKKVFNRIYSNKRWPSIETVSGPGSTIEYTESIRKEIPRLIEEFKVRTILDAPCGDYNWFRLIDRNEDVKYIGGDIVESLIEKNNECFTDNNTQFVVLDICSDKLPKADIWLCRDCLFHLSNKEIIKAIENFLKSDIPYLLTSTHNRCNENKNIRTGGFRLLNLEIFPFNFSQPILYIDDWIEGYAERKLALWSKEALKDIKFDL